MVWIVAKVKVYTFESGKENGDSVNLPDDVFSIAFDKGFISMYFARMKSAWYTPTNKTKNVSEISGTTKKPFKQKHNGCARQGSNRSAQMRGGGIAFGPRAVKAFIKIPKGEAVLAKSMLLSNSLREGKLFVVDGTKLSSNKTKLAKKAFDNYSNKNVVIIHDGNVDANSLLAVRNLQNVKYVSNNMLTANDLFYADAVLLDKGSVAKISGLMN